MQHFALYVSCESTCNYFKLYTHTHTRLVPSQKTLAMVQTIKESGSKYFEKRKKEEEGGSEGSSDDEDDDNDETTSIKKQELLTKTLKEYYSSLASDKTGNSAHVL